MIMFRKKDGTEPEDGKELAENILDNMDFYIDYHIAENYPDTELGKRILQDSVFIKEEAKEKMREAAKIFDDPSFNNLNRSEKTLIYKNKI